MKILKVFWYQKKMGSKNRKESYTNKCQKHVAFSYVYKLTSVDDKFSEPLNSYSDQDAVYNFINSMFKESKYLFEVTKTHFNKKLVMTKKMMQVLRTLLNVGSVIILMLMVMLK